MATADDTKRAGAIRRFASRMRFPQLFVLTFVLFVVDVIVPDALPFADEIILGLMSAMFALWRDGRKVVNAPEAAAEQPTPSDH